MIQHFYRQGAAILLLLLACLVPTIHAQDETHLQIVSVDISQFPIVRVTLVTTDSRSAPADLTNLALRENGIPVTNLDFDNVPAGIDAIFVIDANTGFDEIDDDSGLTRREKVQESIQRFANQYMNADDLDRISIVVPGEDRQSGQLLLQNESDPQNVSAVVDAYAPARLGPTPLNAMLNLALEQAQQGKDDSRYQAILLFSDARRMHEQLSYPLLVAQANDANIPIYGAILGQSVDEDEQDNMARLTAATRAFQVHMPQAAATDAIYEIWEQQGNPTQVVYSSRQRQSGRSQISINLGTNLITTDFELTLASPVVELVLPSSEIRRVGTDPDSPLEALQPQFQPLKINISWPDGLPRKLIEVVLFADMIPQTISDSWQTGDDVQRELIWEIKSIDEGSVELVVQALDELGYQGSSTPQTVNVTIDRPLPPTAVPTLESSATVSESPTTREEQWQFYTVLAAILLLSVIPLVWYWRSRISKKRTSTTAEIFAAARDGQEEANSDPPKVGVLEPLPPHSGQSITLDGPSFTLGSDPQNAQVVLNDVSVSRLHARIRRQEQSYWLLDEGSTEGVFLNYERLGLAPRELNEGDLVQLGKLTFRFSLLENPEDTASID